MRACGEGIPGGIKTLCGLALDRLLHRSLLNVQKKGEGVGGIQSLEAERLGNRPLSHAEKKSPLWRKSNEAIKWQASPDAAGVAGVAAAMQAYGRMTRPLKWMLLKSASAPSAAWARCWPRRRGSSQKTEKIVR